MQSDMDSFDKKDFKADKYVQSLVQECIGGIELQQKRSNIQSYAEQTSTALKKHVYANYMQFIETSREISHLESEMYQLSHILSEQRNILSTLAEERAINSQKDFSDSTIENECNDPDNELVVKRIKDAVNGFTGNLDNRIFLCDGSLIELDSNDYRPIQRLYFFLFNDLFIICKVKHDKTLEFVAQYDPKKIAAINIKDLDGIQNAINIITSDGTKTYQCFSAAMKKQWIEKFEIALRHNATSKHKKGPAPKPPTFKKQISSIDSKSNLSESTLSPNDEVNSLAENFVPEWLTTSAEEIQTLLAQRHFEDALHLVQKSEEYLKIDFSFSNAFEISEKVKGLKKTLTDTLLNEIGASQSRSLTATLRSSRRSLKILTEMGKARQACCALLEVSTIAIRTTQRQARRNNLEISELFFCDLSQVASEFLRAFNSQHACISVLIVWCNTELRYFANQLIKHYLTKGSQLEAAAKCIERVRKPCVKLSEIGLDLSYHMEGLLRTTLADLIEESRVRILESIGRGEDTWQPYNLQTKSNLKNILKELENLGIYMRSQVTGDTWINLTQATVGFCRYFLSITESCAYLAKNEMLKADAENLLKEIFQAQYAIKPATEISVDLNFVARNKMYLANELLQIAYEKFQQLSGFKSEVLISLQNELRSAPVPKPRNKYQTEVL